MNEWRQHLSPHLPSWGNDDGGLTLGEDARSLRRFGYLCELQLPERFEEEVQEVALGAEFALVLTRGGNVLRFAPAMERVAFPARIASVSAGRTFALLQDEAGRLHALGDAVEPPFAARTAACGSVHALAADVGGELHEWRRGDANWKRVDTDVHPVTHVAAGMFHSAFAGGSELRCYGRNQRGQCDLDGVFLEDDVQELRCGAAFTLVLLRNGRALSSDPKRLPHGKAKGILACFGATSLFRQT